MAVRHRLSSHPRCSFVSTAEDRILYAGRSAVL